MDTSLSQARLPSTSASGSPNGSIGSSTTTTSTTTSTTSSTTTTSSITSTTIAGSTTTPVFADNFDTGSKLPGTTGYHWTGATSNVTVSSDIAHSGAYSLKFLYTGVPDCQDGTAEQGFSFGLNHLQEVFIEYYIYFPNGTEGFSAKYQSRNQNMCNSPTNNKIIVVFGQQYNGETDAAIQSWYDFTFNDGSQYANIAYSKTGKNGVWYYTGQNKLFISEATDLGHWINIRYHVRISDFGMNNGVVELWKDGQLLLNAYGLDLYDSTNTANYMCNGYLMGWSNSGFAQDTAVYIDDFKIYDTHPAGWP